MKDIIAQRFSSAAQDYDAITPVQQECAQTLFQLLEIRQAIATPPVLLDVGVGSGRLLFLASKYLGENWQLHGIDFAPQMLAQTQARFPNVKLYHADIEQYHYLPSSYDVIVSNFALQWCEQPARLLENLYMSLRSGGQLAVALPLCGSLCNLVELVQQLSGEQLPTYPLPRIEDFFSLAKQIPNFTLQVRNFVAHYQNAYAAVMAIKKAGANTSLNANKQLSMKALRLLHQEQSPFMLDYKVLFLLAKSM